MGIPQVVVDSVLGIQLLGWLIKSRLSKMAFCSAVTLCFASIFSLVSAALLAIAFSTDNWQTIIVRREELKQAAERVNNEDILNKFETSPLYFSRTRGLFRECFHGEKDNAPKITDDLYMSPVETWCHNLNYYIPDDTRETKEFTPENMTRIRKRFEKLKNAQKCHFTTRLTFIFLEIFLAPKIINKFFAFFGIFGVKIQMFDEVRKFEFFAQKINVRICFSFGAKFKYLKTGKEIFDTIILTQKFK